MMITFKPHELRDRLILARDILKKVATWDFYPIDGDYDPADYDDVEITEDTEIDITLHQGLEPIGSTVREVLWWAECLEKGSLIDGGTVVVPGQTIFYLSPINMKAGGIACEQYPCKLGDLDISASLSVDGTKCSITLVCEFSPFNLFAEKELECDHKTYPSYCGDEVFAVISHQEELALDKARAICSSYLFQLITCHDLVFRFSSFQESEDYEYFDFPEPGEDDEEHPLTIRPLDVSRGMPELYELYLEGATTNSAEWAFVSFVKAIEYVSMTVIKRTAHNEVRARLTAREALRPDAPYIESLIELVQQQREYFKQREYIRRTLRECCDLRRVAQLLPGYLGGPDRNLEQEPDKKALTDDLCDAIVATRNYLVHAKAAYESSGKECPDSELQEFVACVKEIAFHAITWYQNIPEHVRVAED